MIWLERLWVGAAFFFVLGLLFAPLERAFPARRGQRHLRPAWGTDLVFFAGQRMLWDAWVPLALLAFDRQLAGWLPGVRGVIADWPLSQQVTLAVLAGDLCVYWLHRAQHRFDWLWRFHGVHHTAEHLDWLAAAREHPLDTVMTRGAINLPALLLGVSFQGLLGLIVFRGLWATFIHSNVRLNLGPLAYVLGSPELHHWHHARDRQTGNYGNLNPLMDLLFGTFHRPPHAPAALGIDRPWPRSYLGLMLHPFRPRRDAARASPPTSPPDCGPPG